MKDWKTTVGGLLGTLGIGLQGIDDPAWVGMLGKVLVMAAFAYFGYQASDKSVGGSGPKG